jgi:hypothetical protein
MDVVPSDPVVVVAVVAPELKKFAVELLLFQFTVTPGSGLPLLSVTCTVMGAKSWNCTLINCPSPYNFVMFCADAGWAQKSPARAAARTTTVSLFKISSSFDA